MDKRPQIATKREGVAGDDELNCGIPEAIRCQTRLKWFDTNSPYQQSLGGVTFGEQAGIHL